ncbi:MAG TPA: CIA30 family protein [Gammaproteobacteria bacterium]|nr:CIA30 family protein [Gammaproteobacteria bacterium]
MPTDTTQTVARLEAASKRYGAVQALDGLDLHVSGGAAGSADALAIEGEVKPGFVFPRSGAMFFPSDTPMQAMDFTRKQTLKLWMRGDGTTYNVVLFTADQHIPLMQPFTAGPVWQKVTIPFQAFSGTEMAQLKGIAFCAGPNPGKFRFEIDQVVIR